MTHSAILRLADISKQFPDAGSPVVRNVSLTLEQGDILGLLGPSGCGKTTLLRIIAGFEHPQNGSVEIAGEVVSETNRCVPPEQRDVGMVFQDYALFPHLTVAKNVAFGLQHLKKLSSRQAQLRVQEVLELVSLSGLGHRYPHELSGGQQQRVALARALAPCPALVLLDEPLSNLDVQVRLRLRQELREILKMAGASAIFVTHDQEEALAISDRVAVMQQGYLEQVGTPEEIYHSPTSRFVAEFVTQANFIPAQRRGNVWETELGHFTIEPHLEQLNYSCSEPELFSPQQPGLHSSNLVGSNQEKPHQIHLMVRQEDLILKPDDAGTIVIRDRQFLGREHHYSLQVPSGQNLIARTQAGKALPVGTRVQVAVPQEAVRVFPSSSASSTDRD
ncbi:MAG: ABC transporter ATP-binding protein [Microcoleaceae cyanobacterium]